VRNGSRASQSQGRAQRWRERFGFGEGGHEASPCKHPLKNTVAPVGQPTPYNTLDLFRSRNFDSHRLNTLGFFRDRIVPDLCLHLQMKRQNPTGLLNQ
jgi:hypothetical protein